MATKSRTFFKPCTDLVLFSLYCCLEAGKRKADQPNLPLDPNTGRNKKGALDLQKLMDPNSSSSSSSSSSSTSNSNSNTI